MRRITLAIAAMLVALSSSVGAEPKTPSHVYQAVGQIEARLSLLLAADFHPGLKVEDVEAPPRMPRHVFAKLALVDQKLETLRRLNGLPPEEPLSVPARLITPSDVFEGVAIVQARIEPLAALYSVSFAEASEPLVEGKKPGDVYARLDRVARQLEALFAPPTLPNDVYRSALDTRTDAREFAETLGRRRAPPAPPRITGKTPSDVHAQVVKLAEALARVAEAKPDCAPQGGVAVVAPAEGPVGPDRVMDALITARADLLEMRLRCGVETAPAQSDVASGKTPSDVFKIIAHTYADVKSAAKR